MSASWEVQKSIYTALSGDSTFMNLISNRLYDEPPTNEQYPYVVIGEMVEIDDNRLNRIGYEVTAILRIYTKPGGLGSYTSKNILEAMNNVLNCKKLSMTGFDMVICKIDYTSTDRVDDKRLLTVNYQVIAHANEDITF